LTIIYNRDDLLRLAKESARKELKSYDAKLYDENMEKITEVIIILKDIVA